MLAGQQSPQRRTQQEWHQPDIQSAISLHQAQASKVYFSGPLVKRLQRMPDGERQAKDEEWDDVFAQLGGTTLSVWDMSEVLEAQKFGKEVPPSYLDITDAFVLVLGSVTIPTTASSPPKKYLNVICLNTAGANQILLSCPDTNSLVSWVAALRLSSWEKSRLEEIYTGNMIRLAFIEAGQWKEPPSKLVRGKFEGAATVRVPGSTGWQPVWAVISARSGISNVSDLYEGGESGDSQVPDSNSSILKRMSALFRSGSEQNSVSQAAYITLYFSKKSKDRKVPFLTIRNVSQAFAVYPERADLINRSTLIKIEGLLGDEHSPGPMKSREGWILIIPDFHGPSKDSTREMTIWISALHDAFGLYGRGAKPPKYSWDPRDQVSLLFGYPTDPNRDRLFLDRELAEGLDPRDDRTSVVRSHLTNILLDSLGDVAFAEAISDQQQIGETIARPPHNPARPLRPHNPAPGPVRPHNPALAPVDEDIYSLLYEPFQEVYSELPPEPLIPGPGLSPSSSLDELLTNTRTVKAQTSHSYQDSDRATGHIRACPTDPTLIREYLIHTLVLNSVSVGVDGVVDLTDHVTRGPLVSSGGHGDIYIVAWKRPISPTTASASRLPTLAVKVMRVVSLQEEGDRDKKAKRIKQLKREMQVWQHLKHPNILPLVGIACLDGDPNFPAIVSPWMDKGTIINHLRREPSAPIIDYMVDIISGLDYLHHFSPQVIHGDMKGANILVDRRGRLYICDFGLSSMTLDISLWDTSATHAGGSTRWMAPELLDGTQIRPTAASDIYAYAMTCFEMLTREVPFSYLRMDGAVATAVVVRNERPGRDLIFDVSDGIWGIITRCWGNVPEHRPTSTDIVRAMKTECQRT